MQSYQSFLEGLFICGEADVLEVVTKENATRIVDVRAEANESAGPSGTPWVRIPLESGKAGQSRILKEAIDQVVESYKKGEKTALH